ncbi:hypothetical protein BRD19_12030 [Halobacteriales archaeon SW_7_65_23]|nr:MAG: hypothetical protein BRD19_12030 [Halobacteriales archaeon SW_7_65_23]
MSLLAFRDALADLHGHPGLEREDSFTGEFILVAVILLLTSISMYGVTTTSAAAMPTISIRR